MKVHTLIAVLARSCFQEKVALWHLSHVKLVQILTRIALLTQTSEPMLTHHPRHIVHRMLIWTGIALGAMPLHEKTACGEVRVEAKPVL
jgi:hypothetical protein